MTNPIRPTDDEARHAAIATLTDGVLMVTRIAFGLAPDGGPITPISDLSHHTRALTARPVASLLIGDPDAKGDPLTHPMLTLQAQAQFIDHGTPQYGEISAHYLRDHPKSKLYIGFTDFQFARFCVDAGHLNCGFGTAFAWAPGDMGLPASS